MRSEITSRLEIPTDYGNVTVEIGKDWIERITGINESEERIEAIWISARFAVEGIILATDVKDIRPGEVARKGMQQFAKMTKKISPPAHQNSVDKPAGSQ